MNNLRNNFINTIQLGKCEYLIPQLPNNFVDIMITSPPYNVDLGNNKYNKNKYDIHNDAMDHQTYIKQLRNIFASLYPKMVSGGRVCINVGDGKNGSIPTHSDIIQFMTKDLDYLLKTTIIWEKCQIGNRTSWGSYMSPHNPSFPTPFEYILIFCKESYSKQGRKEDITISKDEFIKNSLAIWRLRPESEMNNKYGHPAMFPLSLPMRLIQSLSYKNDIVLDIFSGAGTTCLAAAMLSRRWIGFEKSKKYVQTAQQRLNKYLNQNRIFN